MHIPIIRPVLGDEELENVGKCLASGYLTQGKFVARFEQSVADYLTCRHAVAVTSGTAALHLALLALGIGPGDEVIVPSLTWVATANAVSYVGATPVFADVRPETFTLDPEDLARALTPRTRAVIAVHLFGLCADMDEICRLAAERDLFVVEDAACALGSSYQDRPAGTLGHVGCFSFHPRKVITTGEGGMLTTADDGLASALRELRNHGCSPLAAGSPPWAMPDVPRCGYNYRMTDIQGAVGCAQMEKIDAILAERARLAAVYTDMLASSSLILPAVPQDCVHSWQSYVVRFSSVAERNAAAERLAAADIECRPGTHAAHRLRWQAAHSVRTDCCPCAALCEDTSLALPLVHGMAREDQARVAALLCRD